MAFTRGANPIWSMVDLQGRQLDDTYFLFVLQPTIPYQPAPFYQDAQGQTAWANPLRFYANGTLPSNMYFDDTAEYRLEVRRGNTQADALIYAIDNFEPNSTDGGGNIDTVALSTDNQITNPQFINYNKANPVSQATASAQTINIATGWDLVLEGSGGFSLGQRALNSTVQNPTNAPFALTIELSGSWTTAYLRQRFGVNGTLWEGQYVSFSITALSQSFSQTIDVQLWDSQNQTIAEILPPTQLDSAFTEYTGVALIPESTNTDTPPNAFIELRINLPTVANLQLTSVQLVASDVAIRYPYEQDTPARQIDNTYHSANPIVPIGTVLDYVGFIVPPHFLAAEGQIVSRFQYYELFQAITVVQNLNLAVGNPTFSSNGAILFWIGMPVESPAFPAGTVITGLSTNNVTVNNAPTATGNFPVRFFSAPAGDGASTFAVPDLRDYVTAGTPGTLGGGANNGIGAKVGSNSHALTGAELPQHAHALSVAAASGTGGATRTSGTETGGIINVGTGTPFSIVQPTFLVRKIIRFE